MTKTTFKKINRFIVEAGLGDEEILLADGFEDAFIGISRTFNTHTALYDYDKCVDILMKRDKMEWEEAEEYMDYNVLGAYAGENTPTFLMHPYERPA